MCQHLNVLTHVSASEYVDKFASTRKNVDIYIGIFRATSGMCRHLNVLAYMYMSTWCIWICRHICKHRNKCVDIQVGIFLIPRKIYRHLIMSTYVWASEYVEIFVNKRTYDMYVTPSVIYVYVHTYIHNSIWTCRHYAICVGILIVTVRKRYRHLNVLKYMLLFCQHQRAELLMFP